MHCNCINGDVVLSVNLHLRSLVYSRMLLRCPNCHFVAKIGDEGKYLSKKVSAAVMEGGRPNIKNWIVLYPVYINSKKTLAEGRRINASKACENPNCLEIGDCCNYLKVPCVIEADKAYPRDFMQRGRVRVQLKREDGTFINPAITSRKELMLRVAELVPRHHGRTKKQEQAAAGPSSNAGSKKSGKGGKKKR